MFHVNHSSQRWCNGLIYEFPLSQAFARAYRRSWLIWESIETVITDSLNPFEDDGSSDCESVSGTSTDSSQLSEDVVNEHGDNELILVAKGV